MKQNTIKRAYEFEGRGLHTGKYTHMTIKPAPEGTGIMFRRTDAGVDIPAIASNISRTDRSTTISKDGVNAVTIEHIMSAFTGLGVDNAIVEMDNEEVPILDGSASYYVKAIMADGLAVQDAERKYIDIREEIEIKDEKTGSWVKITPADHPSFDVTSDFNSRVLGVQSAHWDENVDYASQIAACRTFVFFHELEFLASKGLVKGGDVENAIVIVEHPVTPEQIERMCQLFNQPKLGVTPEGYLSNLKLHFPDECGRHKLLDLMGDIRLVGGYLNAKVTAYKAGHTINSLASRAVLEKI